MNVTDRFVDAVCGAATDAASTGTALQARRCLLDYLGATFAGSKMLAEKAEAILADFNADGTDATVIGFGRMASVPGAIFINGLASHIAELDDGVISGIVHPGSPVISALLPVAEKEKMDGEQLIRGIVAGYEAAVKMADCIQPSHKLLGYHATATCGTIGAAMGVSAMLGCIAAHTSAAISAAGTLKALEGDSELKPFNSARAALVGFLSVSMARAGFSGPADVLSGNTGFLATMSKEHDITRLEMATEATRSVGRVYVKPYAACRYCHPAIEAAFALRASNAVPIDEIESVEVATYGLAVANHDRTDINSVSAAKMSIPYSVAVALATGSADINEFTMQRLKDPTIVALTKRVTVREDAELSALFPRKTAAVVVLKTLLGDSLRERVDMPKGEPGNPLTDDELEQKFLSLAMHAGKSLREARQIVDNVWNLKRDLHVLCGLL